MNFTPPLQKNSTKILLLGSGELGREVALEAMRLGIEVVAVDRYKNAPAHLIANRSYVINMLDKREVLKIIKSEKPDFILPEIEAISIDALFEAQKLGFTVIPNAEAVSKTMNRKNIRVFADKELDIKTSNYAFIKSYKELVKEAKKIGFPCVIKPVMSSSGHGQSIAKDKSDLKKSWEIAKDARGDASELIIEEFVKFDYEITLLTIRNGNTTTHCQPIGHIQSDGDYIYSWQPIQMSKKALKHSIDIATKITDGLGGKGLFGVELFIKGDEVYFSEVSPRPHDTGMVTMITQSQSQFALHVRAVLGLPLDFRFYRGGASAAYKAKSESKNPVLSVDNKLFTKNSYIRIFGKPESHKGRRMAVVLVEDKPQKALKKAKKLIKLVSDS